LQADRTKNKTNQKEAPALREQVDLVVLTWRALRSIAPWVLVCSNFSENKVKRPLIQSHYLFVANAAVQSSNKRRIRWPERESGQ
jgi:hypothetical protein